MKTKHKILNLFVIMIFSMFLLSCDKDKTESIPTIADNVDSSSRSISIVAAGDVIMHMAQVQSGYDSQNKSYNFDHFFSYIKDYISDADYAICNCETSFVKNEPFSGYPKFNSPNEILSALKNCGFDGLSAVHNHSMDMNKEGVNSTSKSILNSGFDLFGIKNEVSDKNYLVKDINGIKIGITNYSYSTIDSNYNRYLNGLLVPKEIEKKLNLFTFSNIDNDVKIMKETYDNMIKDGAEFTIFYIHWGNEYQTSPSAEQEKLAKMLNHCGVDVIFGSHPHVVQPVRTLTNEESGNSTLVFYSLGNFISNQRQDTMGNSKSQDGLIAKININKKPSGKTSILSYETEPIWFYDYKSNSNTLTYSIMPVESIIENNNKENFPKEVFSRMKESYNSTKSIVDS